jgi:outer membrane receptor protein involved in Fe transport
MNFQWHWLGTLVFSLLLAHSALAADTTLDEIVVQATLRSIPIADLPESVTVLDRETVQAAGVQHFQDVLGLIPNLNWASGTSRPRFFQLRGIGEVEQYQGAPNPSVGFLIDDIDFSGVGMPATLFDTQQIEVLRGPQGTAYGANALAGLISVRTVDPGTSFTLKSEISGATYDTRAAALAVGDGSVTGDVGWRVVAQQYLSDGFRKNAYLNRSSTNGLDEGTFRGKLHWKLTDALQADLTLMHVNINNGYDAWSINNTRTTYSNQPGKDAQRSDGAALRLVATIAGIGELRSVTSTARSKIDYSFDGDWGNDVLWGTNAPYDYYQSDDRNRRTIAEDLRLIGDPSRAIFGRVRWLAGLYTLHLSESDNLRYVFNDQYFGAGSSELDSQYSATNVALYGSLESDLGAHSALSAGIRVEQREAHYSDSADVQTPFPGQTNHMAGGNLSWTRNTGDGKHIYVTAARGYKGAGFNIGSQILSEQRSFGPESLWSLETGFRYTRPQSPLQLQADVFYMRRQNMQVYLSEQLQANNPLAYVFYTQNASQGENYGLEAELTYRIDERWRVSSSASLLRSRYLRVSGVFADLGIDGRAQPFAPSYKLSAAVEYQHPSGWFARLDAVGMGSFYYYTSDSQTSSAYNLENVRLGFKHGPWMASAWVRNLFDAHYAQQGFYFRLIPPDFPNQSFLDRADPRQVGITVNYQLSH